MSALRLVATALLGLSVVGVSAHAEDRWQEREHRHREWQDHDIHRFHERDVEIWRRGQWFQGHHDGRDGWWWVVGNIWYPYAQPAYPYPDPYRPAFVEGPPQEDLAYYCANPSGYYPYVSNCYSPWQPVRRGEAQSGYAPPNGYGQQGYPPPQQQGYEQGYVQQGYAQQGYPPPQQQGYVQPQPQQDAGGIDKAMGGTLIGALGGALLGAQMGKGSGKVAATAVGTLLGAFVGRQVGNSLDHADQQAAYHAEQNAYAAPIGQNISWNNPQTGNSGYITPTREMQDQQGRYCRELEQVIVVGGQQQRAIGTSCQQPDGSWRIVGQPH